MRGPSPPTLRPASPVTAMLDRIARHSTSEENPLLGESLLTRVPEGHACDVVLSYPRTTIIWPGRACCNQMRSSVVALPMKYRPPESFDASSTLQVVLLAFTLAARK